MGLKQSVGRDIDSKLPDTLKQMVICTGAPHSHFPLKTYMLRTGLSLKLRLQPWHSILIVKLVNTLEAWHREMITKLGKKFAV